MGIVNNDTDIELRKEYLDAKSKFQYGIVERAQKFWLYNDFIYKLSGLYKDQEVYAKKLHGLTNAVRCFTSISIYLFNPLPEFVFIYF